MGVTGARAALFGLSLVAAAGAALGSEPTPIEVRVLDARGVRLDPQRTHVSMSRTLPSELGAMPGDDLDALTFVFVGPPDSTLEKLELLSRTAEGAPLDVITQLRASATACPPDVAPELVCRQSDPIRAVGDVLDRQHPAVRHRSIRVQVGGSVQISAEGQQLLSLPVGGPRVTRLGPIERLRVRLRPLVLRAYAGAEPAVGGDEQGARKLLASELEGAAALWGQCGIEFSGATPAEIQVVDPPPTRLLSVGCNAGQVASGGVLELRVGRREVRLATRPGEHPLALAQRLAGALEEARLGVSVWENQRTAGAAVPTADLMLRSRSASLPAIELISSDPSLPVCLGMVDLSDGLTHFRDADAFAGTLEERALLRGLDDGDPGSVEILVVPNFAHEGRIGESFIAGPGSSLSNAVIIDRTAIRAGARSYALAHELGHVLLAMPGHPDDFGVDQSWSLMDADVADPTVFGPRRISVSECERALTQTGPEAFVPLLKRVPLDGGIKAVPTKAGR